MEDVFSEELWLSKRPEDIRKKYCVYIILSAKPTRIKEVLKLKVISRCCLTWADNALTISWSV